MKTEVLYLNSSGDLVSIFPYPHYNHTNISYYLEVNTVSQNPINPLKYMRGNDDYEVERIKWALEIVENASNNLIDFHETNIESSADMIIRGYSNDSFWFAGIQGFGGPQAVDASNAINQSEVHLFPDYSVYYDVDLSWSKDDCPDFPLVEVHEILHAFGFAHVTTDRLSVMAPIEHKIQSCDIKHIDSGVANCLQYIYSRGAQGGSCEKYSFFPWENETLTDFNWTSLPLSYSIFNCPEKQSVNIRKAEAFLEKHTGNDLFYLNSNDFIPSQINFYCNVSSEDIVLNAETDYWNTGVYFPAAQPSFNFINGTISDVKIILFGEDRACGGIEVHEFLHGLGFREHNSDWLLYETSLCSSNVLLIDKEIIRKINQTYFA